MNKVVYKPLARFPSVRRDLSLLLNKEVQFNQLATIAKKSERKLLKNVGLFDVYQGKGVETGKKSLAITVELQPNDATLTDKEIDALSDKITKTIADKTGGVLRG